MDEIVTIQDYQKAYRAGKKDYQDRLMKGLQPTLKVLDDILPPRGHYQEVNLGLVQIPMEQIVGTKSGGRSNAFAGNFMPILSDGSEFAAKWVQLCASHVKEGIRDPIKAYEYMNEFYVEEGNKRVSVLKYFQAVSVPGNVTRILPPRTEEKQNRIYYEFVDFYEGSRINYIWFSKTGSFKKLLDEVGKEPGEIWTEEERLAFSSVYTRFSAEFERMGGGKLDITPGDAFLTFISLYGYQEAVSMTTTQVSSLVSKGWEEYQLKSREDTIDLKMDPQSGKKSLLNNLNRLLPLSSPNLKIAFVYAKTPLSSAWTYSHELGRFHLEETFPKEVTTISYENVDEEGADEAVEDAIRKGCNIVFTTSPVFASASVKAAIAHPQVRILNCSLNLSHRYIRTYYARMYEAKFIMGAIAGALTENDRVGYIADYPLYGAISNINAFALGAKMINPRAEVYLEWSTRKETDPMETFRKNEVAIISDKDMVIPEDGSRFFGLYWLDRGIPHSLAMPVWHWGKFYERLIRTIMDGTWKNDDKSSDSKAINYWWGMSAGVIDLICSQNLPIGTRRLIDLLTKTIHQGEFNPFSGILYSQEGMVQGDPEVSLSPEEIIEMSWLAENVKGSIPRMTELEEQAKPVVSQQGIETTLDE